MKVQKLQRSRETFIERMATKDEKTIRSYGVAINNFENFCMEKYGSGDFVSELKNYDTEDIFEVLQYWINWNNKLAPSSTKVMFSRIKKYLYHRGIKLHQQDINEELEFRTLIQEERYGLTLDDIQTIVKPMRYKHRTQFICQLSSLMRIGEITQLRKKHLISGKQNIIVKIPATIAKLKKARTTFFSKEASRLLRPLLREIDDEDLVFGIKANTGVAQVLRRILIKTGLDMKYESSGDYMINTHSFRAYGITKLSRHDPNLAKKLAGQKGYLDQYDRINDDEKLELYQKYELDLIVDDSAKKQTELDKVYKEKSKLEEEKTKYVHLQKDFENLKDNMENIISEKINQYSTKFIKDLEEMMDDSRKQSSLKMREKDLKLFKKLSENDSEFKKIKSMYYNQKKN